MFVEIETKNGALVDRLKVKADTAPRVGEVIHLPGASSDLQAAKILMVIEVYHQLDDGLLETVVRCRPSRGGEGNMEMARLELLEETGWLRA